MWRIPDVFLEMLPSLIKGLIHFLLETSYVVHECCCLRFGVEVIQEHSSTLFPMLL